MPFADKKTPLPTDLPLPEWVAAHLGTLQQQLVQQAAELQYKAIELQQRDLKIQKLTLEQAHHKRIRFGCKAESRSAEQRDLFLESADEDGAAIVAEIEAESSTPIPRKKPSGRKALPPELPPCR